MSRSRCAALIAGGGLIVGALGGVAHAGPTGQWTQITRTHNGAAANLGLARGKDGTLHVLWAGPARRPYTSILDTMIAPSGSVGKPQNVLSGWSSVNAPGAVSTAGSIHAMVSGQKVNTTTDPNAGLNDVVGPGVWKVGAQAFGKSPITVASNADVSVGAQKGGDLVTVWRSAASMLYQAGIDPSTVPKNLTPAGDPATSPVIAVDQASGDVVIAYHGVGSGKNFFRRILPALGSPSAMPQDKQDSPQIAARDGGGVFTAYTPDGKKVWLLRYAGKAQAVPVPPGIQVGTAGVAAGPDGRLWLYYGNEQTTYVTRTNKAVSRYEPVQTLKSPPGAVQYFRLEGEGSAGPLDLFADVTVDGQTKDGSYHQQVLPELSAVAAKKAVKNQQGTVTAVSVTVTVTDAGDPIAGASVSGLPGGPKTTGAKGSVTISAKPGTGSLALAAKKGGYVGASASISV